MLSTKYDKLHWLNLKVIGCTQCPRLSYYIRQIGQEKVKRFAGEKYWARPLPSWGDPNARLLIVGLAPAAHGGNRTGRMFTGDGSGEWLAKAMYESGFANMPTSRSRDDGLVLKDAYITAAIRCAPPHNKPVSTELANCAQYLVTELQILDNIKVIVMLGKIGFDAYCRAAGLTRLKFSHGASYNINGMVLLASYHPSRQNTNTGKLTWQMWCDIFKKVRSILGPYG
ncbi:MAG: uracil-DNA glycosylase [Thermoproteota archaeon]|nr:uracil-DNA glycosylase [Thermoproteota archaeon]